MKAKKKIKKAKSTFDREMENPEFRNLFEESWPAFQVEVQLLKALEGKQWSYSDLAKVLHTQKSAISRDLKGGGIRSASITRIAKMAEALGMRFIPFCVSEKKAREILPAIKKLLAA